MAGLDTHDAVADAVAAARSRLPHPAPGIPDLALNVRTADTGLLVRVEAEQLGAFDDDFDPAAPVLALHATDFRALLAGQLGGSRAWLRSAWRVPGGTDGPVPPAEHALAAARLEALPGVDLVVAHQVHHSPFGNIAYWERFIGGQPDAIGFAPPPRPPEVTITWRYRSLLRLRDALAVLDALADGGQVDGPMPHLMAAAGLLDSPATRAALAATWHPALETLAAWAELVCSPAWLALTADTARVS